MQQISSTYFSFFSRAVHITAQTRSHLGDSYDCQTVSSVDDDILNRYNINTFLIYPPKSNVTVRIRILNT